MGASAGTFQATPFGRAALGSCLPPELCMHIRDDLARARESFVLTTELHLTYLCIPATEDIQPDWPRLLKMAQTLSPADTSVATKVGLDMSYMISHARGFGNRAGSSVSSEQQCDQERVCRRFWAALILTDLLQEMSLEEVHEKYGVVRGTVQGLQGRACRYAGMVAVFCERLGWNDLELLVSKFQARVLHGVRPEVVCLMEIPYVKAYTARLLYKAGLRTPESVAMVGGVDRVAAALMAGRVDGNGAGKNDNQAEKNRILEQARRIIRAAKELLRKRAKVLKAAATEALQLAELDVNANMNVHQAALGEDDGGPNEAELRGQEGKKVSDSFGRSTELGTSYETSDYNTSLHNQISSKREIPLQQQKQQQQEILYFPSARHAPAISVASSGVAAGSHQVTAVWELSNAIGVTTLTDVSQVAGLRNHLKSSQQQPRFAFQFDLGNPPVQPIGGLAFPPAAMLLNICHYPTQALPQQQGTLTGSPAAGRVHGVALSWKEGQAFYIPLSFTSSNAGIGEEISALFADPSFEKVTFDFKTQLAALQTQNASTCTSTGVEGSSSLALKLEIVAPCIDVRIAAFLLNPDDSRLCDGPLDPVTRGLRNTGNSGLSSGYNKNGGSSSSSSNSMFTPETLGAEILGPIKISAVTRCMQLLTQLGGRSTAASRGAAAGRRAALASAVFATLRPRLDQQGLLGALMSVEMPIVPIIATMERSGVGINIDVLSAQIPALRRRLAELEQAATTAAGGHSFNLASPLECAEVLYELLELPPPPSAVPRRPAGSGSVGTATGIRNLSSWSTKSEVLEDLKIAHPECPVPGIISEHRTLSKLLVGCEELLIAAKASSDKTTSIIPTASNSGGGRSPSSTTTICRVFGTFHQTRAATGRLTMDNPNLQNLPRPLEFNVGATPPAGPTHRRQNWCNMRLGVVAPPGRVLLSADFCQLELRILAHLSKDPVLLERLKDGERDPFECLAAVWLHIHPPAQVTLEDRNKAKKMAYAMIYGMGKAAIARELGMMNPGAENEAAKLVDSFLAALPGVRTWMQGVKAGCRATGQVRTLSGRLRRLGTRGEDQARVERQAVNSVCQGSAADVAKLAMVAAVEAVESVSQKHCGGREIARVVLQIHDEFIFEVDAGELGRVACVIRNAMESAVQLAVPLRVRVAVGSSWGDLKELVPEGIY